VLLEGLRELDQGELEGQLIVDALAEHAAFFAAWKQDPTEVRVPGGETMAELAARAELALTAARTQAEAEQRRVIAVVCHQMTQAAVVCQALRQPLERWSEFQLRNACANLLAWDGREWSLQGRGL